MKVLIFLLFIIVSLPLQLLAYEARSVSENIYAPDKMSGKQRIYYNDISGDKKQIRLTSVHTGNELNTEEKRSIVIIKDHHDLVNLPPELHGKIQTHIGSKSVEDFYIFANFVHTAYPNTDETDFYIAIIPKSASVTKLYFQTEWFGEGAGAHNQIRIILDKAITLIPQLSDSYPTYTLSQPDIIYSLQAVRVAGGLQSWDPLSGLMGEYGNALQFFSTEAKAKQQITTSFVENYEIINMHKQQRKAVFERALSISNQQQEMGIYNTVFNSCVTHAMLALKGGFEQINQSHFNPYSSVQQLRTAGLRLKQEGSLNSEFGHLVESPIRSFDEVKNTKNYQLLSPFMGIITDSRFDTLIRELALYINRKKIRAAEMFELIEIYQSGKFDPKNQENSPLIKRFKDLAQEHLPQSSVEDIFLALKALHSQP